LLRRADLALAKSRLLPGNCLAHYAEALDAKVHQRRQLETEMRQALDSGQLTIVYQPQIGESGTRMVGAEALLRWKHPKRGFISPLDFLPVAEETGLIAEIGRMVLVKACREALNWPGDIRVAVNVSPLQFELVDMLGDVRDALERTGLPPERLELEITEGLLLQHQGAAIDTLRALSALGVKIAIDDFGTGFSSLAYLSQLPFDVLKIDKSFVDAMIESDTATRIVETIIQLGRQLDKCVLAEGVETLEQVEMLEKLGCDVIQGYYYGRPGAPEAIVELASNLADVERQHQDKAAG
jgi:EAL domain-containing protein (putative c-di-GMP-specific phosphodiesterase class I)